ncbi:MAG: hypothetical protein R3F60_12225 [bacterium]
MKSIGLLACLAVSACATAETEEGGRFRGPPDALVGGGLDGGVEGATASRLLFYQLGADSYLASAAGTDARLICENAVAWPDADGRRALCRPETSDQPLRLYDVANDLHLVEFSDWRASNLGPPLLSPEGTRVAFKAEDDDFHTLVRVFDENGVLVDEVEAFELLGFARDDVLVVDMNQPALWKIGSDPVVIGGSNPMATGPDPAGLVFERFSPSEKVYFHDADTGRARELADGILADVYGDRVLVLQNDPNEPGLKRGLLLDLQDSAFEKFIAAPRVPFDRTLRLRLTGPNTVIAELSSFSTCGVAAVEVPTRTTWYDTRRDEVFEIDDTDGQAHLATVDARGERALVLDVDACGNPLGTGRIKNLRSGEVIRLAELVQGAFSAAALSPDGRFVAVSQADGVRVIDLASMPPIARPASSGAPGGTALTFR